VAWFAAAQRDRSEVGPKASPQSGRMTATAWPAAMTSSLSSVQDYLKKIFAIPRPLAARTGCRDLRPVPLPEIRLGGKRARG
jgi:hypothetical protein